MAKPSSETGCLLMLIVSAVAIVTIVGAIKIKMNGSLQARVNQLRETVNTDSECAMLDNAQLALDMDKPEAARQQLKRLEAHLKETQ